VRTWRLILFCPKLGLALCACEAQELLALFERGGGTAVVNLGKGKVSVKVEGDTLWIDSFSLRTDELKAAAQEEDGVTFFEHGEVGYKVAFFRAGRYYKLKCVGKGVAPTLEISGIHMHNIVGTDPWNDAKRKVELVSPSKGDRVLDVCTGLGYTAIHSMKRGAEVVSIEKDRWVLEIAEFNPWSRELSSPRVTLLLGDAFEVVEDLPEGFFDAAVHDPPRFSLAGELYSLEFYSRLRRTLRKGARLFHYTGWPGKHRGVNIQSGIAKRLRASGFRVLRVLKGYGILAEAV